MANPFTAGRELVIAQIMSDPFLTPEIFTALCLLCGLIVLARCFGNRK